MKTELKILPNVLFLTFDGSMYDVLRPEKTEYRVGEIICELDRATSSVNRIVDNIMKVSNFDKTPTTESIKKALDEIEDYYCQSFGVASGVMLVTELSTALKAYIKKWDSGDDIFSNAPEAIKEEILSRSRISEVGMGTVGQLLISGLILQYGVLKDTIRLNSAVMDVLERTNDPKAKILQMGQELFNEASVVRSQHYDYRIVNIEGKLTSVFGLQDSFSLILFEVANCINNKVELRQCKHCGRHFPLYGRTDTIYCSFPFGEDGKTCREIGAQATRAEKLKNDVAASEYRKLYLRIKMQVRRHPEDGTLKGILDELMKEGKEYRRRLDANEISEDMYLEWLNRIEKKYKEKK